MHKTSYLFRAIKGLVEQVDQEQQEKNNAPLNRLGRRATAARLLAAYRKQARREWTRQQRELHPTAHQLSIYANKRGRVSN